MGRSLNRLRIGSYDDLACEYYDPIRHPTCTNFREGSRDLIERCLGKRELELDVVVEVGAGHSIIAEMLMDRGVPLRCLTLLDASAAMLAYSQPWVDAGAIALVGDAGWMPIAENSVSLLVSCLGDAYNRRPFWQETWRILKPTGIAIYTTPSFDWAAAFRTDYDQKDAAWAEFELRSGEAVRVPSMILPRRQQEHLIESVGFEIIEVVDFHLGELRTPDVSPKLLLVQQDTPIVTGYLERKR